MNQIYLVPVDRSFSSRACKWAKRVIVEDEDNPFLSATRSGAPFPFPFTSTSDIVIVSSDCQKHDSSQAVVQWDVVKLFAPLTRARPNDSANLQKLKLPHVNSAPQ